VTAAIEPPKRPRRERRIIERPRLTKLLDETEARVILLLAPAGYGKTTLARQWAKTLNGAIWISLTPAHRDVATFARDVAAGIDSLGGNAAAFVSDFLSARKNPQREGTAIAVALADRLSESRIQWLVIDDHHELLQAPEVDEVIGVIQERAPLRMLIASRTRPSWATSRRIVYGEVLEIERSVLAMDDAEARQMLGPRPDAAEVSAQAAGWPAVLALAAASENVPANAVGAMPGMLYEYFAEEIFRSAPQRVQQYLLELALVPESAEPRSSGADDTERSVSDQARELGFVSLDDPTALHPLLREFLLQKLVERRDAKELAASAVTACISSERWSRAFELILRFTLSEYVGTVLEAAYKPLVRSGRFGTLSAFAASIKGGTSLPPVAIDLVDADLALHEGSDAVAFAIASRVARNMPEGHELASRAWAVAGQSAFAQGELQEAQDAYQHAHTSASDDQDLAEALYGWALAAIQSESNSAEEVMREFRGLRHNSPLDIVRYSTAELARRRFAEGFRKPLPLGEAMVSLRHTPDPRARSSFAFTASYVLALQSEYDKATEMAQLVHAEIEEFNLDFARPYSDWNDAFIALGLRRFGAAERGVQLVEDAANRSSLGFHILNSRVLRARLSLCVGDPDSALRAVVAVDREAAIPSMHGEYLATRALALAVSGDEDRALATAREAAQLTRAVEVRLLLDAVSAILGATHGDPAAPVALLEHAAALSVWDPVITALRAHTPLADILAEVPEARSHLEELYARTKDTGLARRAGFRVRSSRTPADVLSPRELEVLGLIARGLRNRDIARALVISESTTKVHVRHILEKLGVRTRTQAVARLEMFE